MAKKNRPPKRQKSRRQKKYNPKKLGDEDYDNAQGFMQGVTRGLRSVVGTDSPGAASDDLPEGTSPAVKLIWSILIVGAAGFFIYRYFLT